MVLFLVMKAAQNSQNLDIASITNGIGAGDASWPQEPFRSQLVETMCSLGIPSFVKKYPELATTILYQILRMIEQLGSIQSAAKVKSSGNGYSTNDQESNHDGSQGQSADEVLEIFRQMWEKSASGIQIAEEVFGEAHGIESDVSEGFWTRHSWSQLQKLSMLLGKLKQIRDLIANLGRSSERGRRYIACQQVPDSKSSRGSYKSPLQPQETGGVCRSGDLSRMTAGECHLLLQGRHGRLLHSAKRLENDLLCYERSGWLEDMTRSRDRTELRPGLKRGPIILCLDTSGSMVGPHEKIAKAVTLECAKVAHKERRDCVVFSFSGSGQAQELELSLDKSGIQKMMDFLDHSFHGGTDVDTPLQLSLDRIQERGWHKADILMVTDGEIYPPDPALVDQMSECSNVHGVEMHGLLLCRYQNYLDDTRRRLGYFCSDIHVFESWKRDI